MDLSGFVVFLIFLIFLKIINNESANNYPENPDAKEE
jgi:hypothetical protein